MSMTSRMYATFEVVVHEYTYPDTSEDTWYEVSCPYARGLGRTPEEAVDNTLKALGDMDLRALLLDYFKRQGVKMTEKVPA